MSMVYPLSVYRPASTERSRMCIFGSPSVPKPPPPPQAQKAPDTGVLTSQMRNNRNGLVGGAVRTGPAGLQPSSLNTGTTRALGE